MGINNIFLIDKIILAITAYQSVIFSVILFIYTRNNNRTKRILGYYMLLNFIYYLYNFFYYNENYNITIKLYYIILPVILLLQPFLFTYIRSLIDRNFKCSFKYSLHFTPAIVVLLMNIFLYSFLSNKEQIQLMEFGLIPSNKIFNFYTYLHIKGYHIILGIQAIIYISIILYTIYKHKKQLSDNFSNTEGVSLNWLMILLIFFVIISVVQEISGNIDSVFFDTKARIGYNIFYMFTVAFIGIGGIIQKDIYNKKLNTPEESNKKYKSSSLDNKTKEELIKKLKIYLEKEKPYLNSELRLDDLSNLMNTNRQYLSQIINETFNQNFYTLINNYRIEEIKSMFLENKHKQLSIMGIARSVGFNSKSTFNTLFKKHTGLTPSDFIKKHNL